MRGDEDGGEEGRADFLSLKKKLNGIHVSLEEKVACNDTNGRNYFSKNFC